jgi:hypothetical protein
MHSNKRSVQWPPACLGGRPEVPRFPLLFCLSRFFPCFRVSPVFLVDAVFCLSYSDTHQTRHEPTSTLWLDFLRLGLTYTFKDTKHKGAKTPLVAWMFDVDFNHHQKREITQGASVIYNSDTIHKDHHNLQKADRKGTTDEKKTKKKCSQTVSFHPKVDLRNDSKCCA